MGDEGCAELLWSEGDMILFDCHQLSFDSISSQIIQLWDDLPAGRTDGVEFGTTEGVLPPAGGVVSREASTPPSLTLSSEDQDMSLSRETQAAVAVSGSRLPVVGDAYEELGRENLDFRSGYKCPVCGCRKIYYRKGDLKVHVRAKHSDIFDRVAHLLSPPKSSSEGKLFCCPYSGCLCGYKHEKDLVRHLKMMYKRRDTRHPVSLGGK